LDHNNILSKKIFDKFSFNFWLIICIVISLAVTCQLYFGGAKVYEGDTHVYTEYNNYVIFNTSFYNLWQNKNLYILYPNEQWDLYKYSPSFAFLFGVFAVLPNFIGLFFWNFINSFFLFYAVNTVDSFSNRAKNFILVFNIIELFTSIQNAQSNALIAGLILLAFTLATKEKLFLSTLCIVLTVYIKLFGGVAFVMYLFFPNKLKTFLYSLFWTIVLFLIPLIIITPGQLIQQYSNWLVLLKADKDASLGYSIFGWLKTWFNIIVSKNILLVIGLAINLLPLLVTKHFKHISFRLLFLSSILIWVVIFNHKAESPTFIIATLGVAIWYTIASKTALNKLLLLLVLVFTILSPTDIFPKSINATYVIPFVLKGVACIFVWFKIMYELYFFKAEDYTVSNDSIEKYH
jgi:hypothetical protein